MIEKVRKIEKPWGWEIVFAHTDVYVGKILHVEPGHALSLQYHEKKDETLYLSSGRVELQVEENGQLVSRDLGSGESYRITAGTKHRMVAGPDGCELIEVSTPELDDVIRIEDRYGRA